jgi:hypothetical protein
MTSVALTRSVFGMVRPSSLAVLRLMTRPHRRASEPRDELRRRIPHSHADRRSLPWRWFQGNGVALTSAALHESVHGPFQPSQLSPVMSANWGEADAGRSRGQQKTRTGHGRSNYSLRSESDGEAVKEFQRHAACES